MLNKQTQILKQSQQLKHLKEKARDTEARKIKNKALKTKKAKKRSKEKFKHMAHDLSDSGSSLAYDESSPAIEGDDSMTHFGDPSGTAFKKEQTISLEESLATNKEQSTTDKTSLPWLRKKQRQRP